MPRLIVQPIIENAYEHSLERMVEVGFAEVGEKVGYRAPHSFTRFFKKMTGLSPQEYRDGLA